MGMKKLITTAAFAIVLSAFPAVAQRIPLSEISKYFNSFETAETSFTQINSDGSKSTGRLYIQRPGRARFEYDPPQKFLVLAGAGKVAIFDGKSNSNPEEYPLRRTPLSIVLARNVDLASSKMVVAHKGDEKLTTVTAQDPKHPDYGTIELGFSSNPVRLRQWVVTNNTGEKTKVILDDLTTGKKYSVFLFSIVREAEAWNK